MAKTTFINIRTSPDTKELIRALAQASGQSVSRFMLQASTVDVQLKSVLDIESLKEIVRDR